MQYDKDTYMNKYIRILHLQGWVDAEIYARIVNVDDFGYILEIETIPEGKDLVPYVEGDEIFVSKNSAFDFIFATPAMTIDAFTRDNELFVEFAKESRGINLSNGNYNRNENLNAIVKSMSYEEQVQIRDKYRIKYRTKYGLVKE